MATILALNTLTWLTCLGNVMIFLVNYAIFKKLSDIKVTWWYLLLGVITSCTLASLLPKGTYFWVNPLILIFFSYRLRPGLTRLEHVFFGVYAWGVTDLIIRVLGLLVFPILVETSLYTEVPVTLFSMVAVLLTYPIYLLIHHHMGFEYLNIQGKRHFLERVSHILTWLTSCFVLYGGVMNVLPYLSHFLPNQVIINYSKLIIILFTTFFLGLISNANRWIRDMLFQELEEEQERHFQSLRDSNKHILRLYQELSREGIPQAEAKLRASITNRHKDYGMLSETEISFIEVLPDISNIFSHLLRSTIEGKYMEAKSKGIDLILEVPEQMVVSQLELVDLSVIVASFLDNAMQVAGNTKEAIVRLSIFQNANIQFVLVETRLSQDKLGTLVSDKNENQDLDLTTVRGILERYPQATLEIKNDHHLFRQSLSI